MMASNPRFDISSSSTDGSTFNSYSNGQRNHFSGASNLERSSSFREGIDNRMIGGPNLPRGSTLQHTDHMFLSQLMNQVASQVQSTDSVSLGDGKSTKQPELRKVMLAAVGLASEDPAVQPKPLSSLGLEELKRVKSYLQENSLKARERSKCFIDAINKLEKHRPPLSLRKRPRTELVSNSSVSGDRTSPSNLVKVGSQIHQGPNSVDSSVQRSEERKLSVPSKKTRTSIDIRPEGRPNNLSRPSVLVDRDREVLRSGSCLAQPDDKERTFQAGPKGKRSGIKSDVSGNAMTNRMVDGDRDIKRNAQQRPTNDGRSRLSESHSFRSGTFHGMLPINKAENSSQSGSLNVRNISRNEHDSATAAIDKKERPTPPEKDRTVVKSSLKQTNRDESHTASSIPITKKASRAPRSNSGASANSSPHFTHPSPTFEGWERPSGANKVQLPGTSNNRKRPLPTRSSSPPVGPWGNQRFTKFPRVARRTSMVPPVSSRDDVSVLAEGSPNLDSGSKPESTESNASGFQRRSSNNTSSQQTKFKNENTAAGLSESEESGAGDNKCKDKNKRPGELEEKVIPTVQKPVPLVLHQKKKLITKEEGGGDGVRRQGRSGRGLAPIKANNQQSTVKLENAATSKQLRSARPVTEKGEIKSGRPPSKKLSSERKPITRPRRPLNSGSSDFTGESDDDREDLLLAVDAAVKASESRCGGTFWKHMEPFFANITNDDMLYLKKQVLSMIRQLEDKETAFHSSSSIENNGRAEVTGSTLTSCPSSAVVKKESTVTNDAVDHEIQNDVPEKCEWFETMIPLSQRLLSALIIEEDAKEANRVYENGQPDEYSQGRGDFSFGLGNQTDSYSKDNEYSQGTDNDPCYDDWTIRNGYQHHIARNRNVGRQRLEDEHLFQSEIEGLNPELRILEGRHAYRSVKSQNDSLSNCNSYGVISDIANNDTPYENMCLDKRILLELHSIGLFPEFVPDLAQRDEEEISEDISRVQERLKLQVSKTKNQMCNLEKAITEEREAEGRKLELLALSKLVEKAYEKYLGSRGTNSSGGKSTGSKVAKQANIAFVRRTLAKCRKFEETGKSCFSEPSLKERLHGLSGGETNTKAVSDVIEVAAATVLSGPTHVALDLKTSGVTVENPTMLEKTDNGDRESCDTLQVGASSVEQVGVKDELWNTRMKKELPLEDVGNGLLKGVSSSGCNLVGGAKGKRSERDRDGKGQNKEILTRSGAAKGGRQGISNAKGERKKGSKPKQKTTQLSVSVNGLVGKTAEAPKPLPLPVSSSDKIDDKIVRVKDEQSYGATETVSHEEEGDLDLSNIPLPSMDDLVPDDLGVQAHDFGSWLNIDDESLPATAGDLMGLDVPMDDLSELEMIR